MPIAGGTPTQIPITVPGWSDASFENYDPGPSISADGKELLFIASSVTANADEVFTVPVAGGVATAIPATLTPYRSLPNAYLSPDGQMVAFTRQSNDGFHIWVAPIKGGAAVDLGSVFGITTWRPEGLIVNVNSDQADPPAQLAKGACDVNLSGSGTQCTLRAAIQVANATAANGNQRITFDLPEVSGKIPTIDLTRPLPVIDTSVTIDGTSQPKAAANLPGVVVDGRSAGPGVVGLDLTGNGSTLKGVALIHFHGQGAVLNGDGITVEDCAFFRNATGLEVNSKNDVIGGESAAGNIFFANGDFPALKSYADSLHGRKPTAAQIDAALANFGAGILIRKSGVSNVTIDGNLLGVHGTDLPQILPPDKPDSALGSTFGVLIVPSGGTISGVTIGGGSGHRNVISGNLMGVAALDGGSGSITDLKVVGNLIGPQPDGSAYSPLGNLIGVMASGTISHLTVGGAVDPNKIEGNVIGALITGQNVSSANVVGNAIGSGSISGSGTGLKLRNGIGVVLADTNRVTVGGALPADGNQVLGDVIGVILADKHSENNILEHNVIGLKTTPTESINASNDYAGVLGVLDLTGNGNRIGGARAGNTIQGFAVGGFTKSTGHELVQGNTVNANDIGWLADAPSRSQYGGSAAGAGDEFSNNLLGMLLANKNLSAWEEKDARLNGSPISRTDLEKAFGQPSEGTSLNVANATSAADIGPTSVDILPEVGFGNVIQGSRFGAPPGQPKLGNDVAMILSGDLHGTKIGGTVAGDGNVIADNHQAGIWLVGDTTHYPTASILGNRIEHNDDFSGPLTGVPGLGIDLITAGGSGFLSGHGLGPDSNDPRNPANGPNGLQNYPVLTKVTQAGASVKVAGTLHSAPLTAFRIELFANDFCNPYGYGEGQRYLGYLPVVTDKTGDASFSDSFSQPWKHARYVTATATTNPGLRGGRTSEFSRCTKIR